MVKGPGVVTGRYGTIGQVFYVEGDFWPLNTTLYVRDFKGNDRKFIHYFLKRLDFHAYSDKAAVPGVNRNDLHDAVVSIPPVSVQNQIAAFLGALDDRITLLRETNATLEAIAQALFKSWFVDFDPVRAKMAGRAPEGMDDATAALFPDALEETELGVVPKGWNIAPIGSTCTLGRGASPRPIQNFMGGDVPWIKIADATASDGLFIFDTKERVSQAGASKSVAVSPGDLILSNSASCGIPAFVDIHGCIHDGWLYFRDFQGVSKYLLFFWLRQISSHLVSIADGSVQKNLNIGLVSAQPILLPDPAVLCAFDEFARLMLGRVKENCRQALVLADLRDTLLPRLISGQLRLPEAQAQMEAVA